MNNEIQKIPQESIEAKALRTSAWAYLFMALLGGGFFYLSKSEAILLDGVYSFISLLMTFLAQRVSQLVVTTYTNRFHFGFAHFEPMLNVVRILLILAIAGFAAVSALESLLSGGRQLNANNAVIYGIIAATSCLLMAWKQHQTSRQENSPILAVDARNWLVDGILSSGVAITFMIAFLLRDTSYSDWIPYIDPLLVIVMVTLMLPVPLKTLGENMRQVLMQAPSPEIQEEINTQVEKAINMAETEKVSIRMLPIGRFLYLQIHILVSGDNENWRINECDAVRQRIEENVRNLHPNLTMDVIFTAEEHWLALDNTLD